MPDERRLDRPGARATRLSGVVAGRDVPGRALRITSHPEHGRVVLSLWDVERCIGTLRLAPQDVPDLVRLLADSVVVDAEAAADHPARTDTPRHIRPA